MQNVALPERWAMMLGDRLHILHFGITFSMKLRSMNTLGDYPPHEFLFMRRLIEDFLQTCTYESSHVLGLESRESDLVVRGMKLPPEWHFANT